MATAASDDDTDATGEGFTEDAALDDASGLWPTAYALTDEVGDEAWEQLTALVERAVS